MRRIVLLMVLVVAAAGPTTWALPAYPYPTVWATVIDVLDANQILVQIVGSNATGWIAGSQETVRYLGGYANPADPTCGPVATQVNYQMVFGRLVYLEFDQVLRDEDGTLLAYVYLDGAGYSMVNAMLVAMGLARAAPLEPNTRYDQVFQELELTATRLGLGCFVAP
jgi:endonuclease YncB( thermonuclease family)